MTIHYSANTYTFISHLEFQNMKYYYSTYMIPYEKKNDNIKDINLSINLDILYYGMVLHDTGFDDTVLDDTVLDDTVFDDTGFDDTVFDDDDIKNFFIEDEKENTVFCSICDLLWL